MSRDFGGKWGTECLNTRFTLREAKKETYLFLGQMSTKIVKKCSMFQFRILVRSIDS